MAKAQVVPQVRVYQRGRQWWFDVRKGGQRIRQLGGRTRSEAEAAGAQFVAAEQGEGLTRTAGAAPVARAF